MKRGTGSGRRSLAGIVGGLLLLLPGLPARAHDGHDDPGGVHHLHDATASVSRRCADAAQRFLAALNETERAKAAWPFATGLRNQWSYRPGGQFRKHGIRTGELSASGRELAAALLRCGLSPEGFAKAAGVMRLDDVVRDRAGSIVFNDGRMPIEIGQDFFWYTVFGNPAGSDPWGFQVEGHHLTVNFTLAGGRVAATPSFLGAWPAEVEAGPLAGLRVLPGEESRARRLMHSLNTDQRRRAVLSSELPKGLFTSPERADRLTKFEGLPAAALNPAQRELMADLLVEYIGNLQPSLATEWLAEIAADGDRQLFFAWMGATDAQTPAGKPAPMYYRIHGPSVLIEFDHAIDITDKALAPDPNHVHTLVRRPGADMGVDLLARHYAESAHHRVASETPAKPLETRSGM